MINAFTLLFDQETLVIDEHGSWLTGWRDALERKGCEVLRTPLTHSPHPRPGALQSYVQALNLAKVWLKCQMQGQSLSHSMMELIHASDPC